MLNKEKSKKIFRSLDALEKALEPLRDKKIVYTGGVFDLFHYGHLNYLQRAKELGDVLVVHIDSDKLVKKRKRVGPVVVAEDKRAILIASLDFVGFIVVHDKPTGDNILISTIKPDIYVRVIRSEISEEGRAESIRVYKQKYPQSKMIFLKPTFDLSTTQIINSIKQPYVVLGNSDENLEKGFKKFIHRAEKITNTSSLDSVSGAVVVTEEGRIYEGITIKSSYGHISNCAEQVAIQNALSKGARFIKLLVLYSPSEDIGAPCGACRQSIYEVSDSNNPTKIVLVNSKDEIVVTDIHKLLPLASRIKAEKPELNDTGF